MSVENERTSLPDFLISFENLTAHFDEHFGNLGSNERGDSFLNLSMKIIPLVDDFSGFPSPTISEKKSHDDGVDILTSESMDGRVLCVQSKYKVRDKSSLDSIISKFKNFETKLEATQVQQNLFQYNSDEMEKTNVPVFAIITSSKLDTILDRYRKSSLASRPYFERLKSENRLKILSGPEILKILQQLYRKSHLIPANIQLESICDWINIDNVYIGAISGIELVNLYKNYGDALFFENIRDFLGVTSGRVVTTRSTVNQEIIGTITEEPRRMLSRNNGITFRAIEAEVFSGNTIKLKMAAIVNGCQTTMSVVHCENVSDACNLLVKIVVTEDAWDIAKSANYQNEVARIDLDLARYLRPQLVRRIATGLGYAIESDSESNASAVLNTIYQYKIDYDELRLLYLGIFSRKPNNIFDANYTELRTDILESIYEQADSEDKIFSVILMLLKEGRDALAKCQEIYSGEEYSHLFKRFYKDEKPRYRSFLTVAAACAAVRDDISSRISSTQEETLRMQLFFKNVRNILENSPNRYRNAYKYAFEAIADSILDSDYTKSDSDIYQKMFHKISTISFSSFYKRVLIRIDRLD